MEEKIINAMIERRKELNISYRGLQRLTGVDSTHLVRIERGEVLPSIGTISKLYNALGLDIEIRVRE